jgi:hypothetical protein
MCVTVVMRMLLFWGAKIVVALRRIAGKFDNKSSQNLSFRVEKATKSKQSRIR